MTAMAVNLQEAHYCGLFSQSNVYGLSNVCMPGGKNKLLVASLRGKVMSMEFQNTRPLAKEVHFTYIPADAEIVSIDAFKKKSSYGNGVVIGISFIKTTENKPCQFLNIYSAWEPDSEYNLESIAQGCQNLELDFVPYQLTHAELCTSNNVETVFLMAGNDLKVHMYREDRNKHIFMAESSDPYFPEFKDLTHNVSYIDCKTCSNNRRITALGCQNGLVKVFIVHAENAEIMQQFSIQHDSMIAALELFNIESNIQAPVFVREVLETEEEGSEESVPEWHLVVVSALEVSVVYRNLELSGFTDPLVLCDSERYDSALCCHVTDVDLDGQNEILIGTYGQELLVYKYEQPQNENGLNSANQSGTELTEKPNEENLARRQSLLSKIGMGHSDGDYQLIWQRSFPKPILALNDLDITGDGLKEMVVLTLNGLHILQHDLNYVSSLCQDRLKQFAKLQHQGDVFQQLLQESL